MERRTLLKSVFGIIGSVFLAGSTWAGPKLIDRRNETKKRLDSHPRKNGFKGKKVIQMTQTEKDNLLQTLAEIEGLL